ncbi:MAG: hypothetical protein GX767_00945 [Firmicutes bacterium]|nr:hypothetical protein [Bacillota bacterium]
MAKKYNKGRKQKPNVSKKFREAFNVETSSELGESIKKEKDRTTPDLCRDTRSGDDGSC